MPLRDDLLVPIPGEYPSGLSLRYDKVYDQIKEARTEEDSTLPSGAWERQPKKADFNLVIRLAGEALAKRSKDLQLAVWLGEAHLKREGLALLNPVLTLLLELQEQFWETIHPEIEDGDAGMRVVPLQWAANRYNALVREVALTNSGINFHEHKAARAIGYEQDTEGNDSRRTARAEAIAAGRATAEEFDALFSATPKNFYAVMEADLVAADDTMQRLTLYCEQQYGDDGPSFRKLRDAIEEVKHLVSSLLNEKRKSDPDDSVPVPPDDTTLGSDTDSGDVSDDPVTASLSSQLPAPPLATSAQRPSSRQSPSSIEPESWDDALARVQACSSFMAVHNVDSPIPYLLNTAIRWGELRAAGQSPDADFLIAPPTELRSRLRRLLSESEWQQLLSASLAALAEPCGRAWLDVHRYAWTASREVGHLALTATIVNALQSLLREFPQLTSWSLNDDTPTANADTQRWLVQEVLPPAIEIETHIDTASNEPLVFTPPPRAAGEDAEPRIPDVFDIACNQVKGGQLQSAVDLLSRDAMQQPSGRMRYQRRVEIAQLCLIAGNAAVAMPILQQLIAETERRNLESWETGEMIAKPLALLLRCMNGTSDTAAREAIFSKLCRVDPTAALELLP